MKYHILAQVYQSAQEAMSYLSEQGNDDDGFGRDCIMSAVSSFQMAFRDYGLKTKETPF